MLDKSKSGVRHFIVSLMFVKRVFRLVFLMNSYVHVSFEQFCIFFFLQHETDDHFTHFFALKNISFCGFHPRNER